MMVVQDKVTKLQGKPAQTCIFSLNRFERNTNMLYRLQ